MATDSIVTLNDILQKDEGTLLQNWVDAQVNASTFRPDRTSRQELMDHARRFLSLLRDATRSGDPDVMSPAWNGVRQMLDDLSVARAQQGFSPSETATFIFSLKQPLFDQLQRALGPAEAVNRLWPVNLLLDRLAVAGQCGLHPDRDGQSRDAGRHGDHQHGHGHLGDLRR